jgi:hypothetical protein
LSKPIDMLDFVCSILGLLKWFELPVVSVDKVIYERLRIPDFSNDFVVVD